MKIWINKLIKKYNVLSEMTIQYSLINNVKIISVYKW